MQKNVAGIDVSKHELVMYVNGEDFIITNTKKAIQKWFRDHKEFLETVTLYVYEPTGGYEKTLAKFLADKKLPGYRAHANHVRAFATSMGYTAKTDKIDAKAIAEFGMIRGAASDRLLPEYPELLALVNRREQYIEMIKQDENRLETQDNEVVIKDIKYHVKQMVKYKANVETAIKEYVESNEDLSELIEMIQTIPGVGFITAVSVLAYLPELFEATDRETSSLAGLAPMNRDSGTVQKKRQIQGGRAAIRRALYMSTLSAKRWNSVIKDFFDRLNSKGKPFKVSMTAAMRKLLLIIRSVCLRRTPWTDEPPKMQAIQS